MHLELATRPPKWTLAKLLPGLRDPHLTSSRFVSLRLTSVSYPMHLFVGATEKRAYLTRSRPSTPPTVSDIRFVIHVGSSHQLTSSDDTNYHLRHDSSYIDTFFCNTIF